jgi:protein-S-isoprenylcysteine O-methyltransferase Ste14
MLIAKLIAFVVVNTGIFGVLLFAPAATIDWPRGWIFVALVFVATSAMALKVFARDEGLLDERLKLPLQKGQPLADKIILLLCLATWGGLILFIPLDVFRFHVTPAPGFLVSLLGLMLVAAGYWVMYGAFSENAFAASVIRHQEERQQVVIASGVYKRVRHPLYAGGSLAWVGMSLWLGSYAAAALVSIPIALIAVRILYEEHFLWRELEGYDEYSAQVRYRLIPFVW